MTCHCHIIPNDVLERLAKDKNLSDAERKAFRDTAAIGSEIRKLRTQAGKLTSLTMALDAAPTIIPAMPAITVADCHHGQTLPGTPVARPETSSDVATKNAFEETTALAQFYQTVFGRNSVDGQGMTLGSSVHYGVNYNNAFWNGSRMTYGDGDNNIFIDFTRSTDVIGHELTHGVTQYTLQLGYTNEAGGLNESLSDCFGSMFRQWRADQDVTEADWLIGKDIMGPGAIAKGFTCLRDMASPGAEHCLAPQPFAYKDYTPKMDPHYSSGIPNLAFCTIAKAIGGNSWDITGKIWYAAMTQFRPSPNMKMKTFANRTRSLAKKMFAGNAAVFAAVDHGWTSVGL
jgi:Zn-dependent metalloprotease